MEVQAAQGGDSYNLPEGTRLEITNQVFGSKPQFLYAKTATSISGGTTRYLSVVSDQDISDSKTALEDKLLQNIRADLQQKNLTLADKSYNIQDLQFTADKPSGTQSPSFTSDIKAQITGLAFSQDQLKQLIMDRISRSLSGDKTLYAGDSALNFTLKNLDLNNNTMVLDVHFEGAAVYNISLDGIAKSLVGKTQNQVNELLKSRDDVDRIDITLAPIWQKTFPFFSGKITVKQGNPSSGE